MKVRNQNPPCLALRFLAWFCPPSLYESIEGDLMEQFEQDIKIVGEKKAKRRFVWNVIKFFRPGILLRNRFTIQLMNMILISNYFKVSYRYLAKNKTFAAVNIIGLAMGMAAALLIYEYVNYEKSYDGFHAEAPNIYRVTTEWNATITPEDKRATTVPWSGPGAKESFPEVLEFTRFAPLHQMTGDNSLRYKEMDIEGTAMYLADPGFLKMFSFPLIEGDPHTALSNPHQIILTESIAKKYFGDESPLGKMLFMNTHDNLSGNDFNVTGVIQDPPANSHMDFDFLISYSSMWPGLSDGSTYWHWDNTYCYLKLHPTANALELEKKIAAQRVKQFGKDFDVWKDVLEFKLQPLQDIHLYSKLKGELSINGDGRALDFLAIIGIFILLCGYINYINLSTVKAIGRRTEIGVRKVVGSTKTQLTLQLLIESLIINLLSLGLALVIARICSPLMEVVFNIQWPKLGMENMTLQFWSAVLFIVLVGTFLSALYPAFIMTSFRPAEVLKGTVPISLSKGSRWTIRKPLTVVQFIFCIAFATGTFALYQQLKFMKEHDMGMNMDHVVAIRGYGFQSYKSYRDFKAKLSASSLVGSVSSSSAAPGEEIIMLSLKPKIKTANNSNLVEVKVVSVDEDFFKTLDVKFSAGRDFDFNSSTEKDAVILNEAAAFQLGHKDVSTILGQTIYNGIEHLPFKETPGNVVGVIKNYNQRSLHNPYEPIVYVPNWIDGNQLGWNKFFYLIKLSPSASNENISTALNEIKQTWNSTSPEHPFNYFFLDSHFDNQYKSETAFSSLFFFFSAFAIFIACLGLFGLVAFSTLQRTKEIGIRKVLGASVQNILMLLSKDFVVLILIAAAIAIPLVALGLQSWLQSYPFRISLGLWLLTVPLLLIAALSLITIVLKSMKVAMANPVDNIRYE
jgi:putative ABC transport system permease protein